jgi:hypothetical protein
VCSSGEQVFLVNLPCPLRGPIVSPPSSVTTPYSKDSPAQPSLSCKLQIPYPTRTSRHVSRMLCLLLASSDDDGGQPDCIRTSSDRFHALTRQGLLQSKKRKLKKNITRSCAESAVPAGRVDVSVIQDRGSKVRLGGQRSDLASDSKFYSPSNAETSQLHHDKA